MAQAEEVAAKRAEPPSVIFSRAWISSRDGSICIWNCVLERGGVILSSPLWGFLADTQGRKKILILSLAADGIIGVLSSFAPTYGIFLAFRFFNGFFICSPAAVVYAYLGEFHNASTRPKAIILVSVFLPIGVVALPACKQVIPIERFQYVGEGSANIFGLRVSCGQHNEPSSLLSQFSRLKRYLFIQVAPHLSSRG
uniref:Major facilitator superfamily (MFS) profile domain-containing protein n=1 Tax=Timema monikensis TaxID=170555 RepID=A0A7R9EJF4_9NEOP|nr:unnamed protein product [Timema monikensis]